MTDAQTIARNVAVQVLGRGGLLSVALVTTIVLTRHLGPAGYGTVTVCVVVLQLIAPLADPGVSVVLSTEGAADLRRLPGLVAAAREIARRMSWPLVALAVALLVLTTSATGAGTAVAIGASVSAVGLLASSRQAAVTGLLQARSRFGPKSLGDVIGKLAYLLAVVVIVALRLGAAWVLAATVLPPLVLLVVSRRAVRGEEDLIVAESAAAQPGPLLRRALPLGLSVLLFSVYFRLDTLLLAWLGTSVDVGRYGADYRIAETLLVLPTFLTGALMPVLAKTRESDPPRTLSMSGSVAGLLGCLGLGVAVAGPFLARPMLVLLSGPGYAQGATALALLLVSVGASFVTALWGTLLIVHCRSTYLYRFSAANLTVNLVANVALIPHLGPVGAASATLLTEVLSLLLVGRRLVADGLLELPWRTWARALLAVAPVVAFLVLLPHLEVVARGGIAVIGYLGLAVLLRAFTVPAALLARPFAPVPESA